MTKMDELIGINPHRKTLSRESLLIFVKESLKQIGEINEAYKRFFGSEDEDIAESITNEIEQKLESIRSKYGEIFDIDQAGVSTAQKLDKEILKIQDYHAKLLLGDNSIRADIEESKKYIVGFYNYLFAPEGKEILVKNAISRIEKFYTTLTNKETGYEREVTRFYEDFKKKHAELFLSEAGKQSKISNLDDCIKRIDEFSETLQVKIKPFFSDNQRYAIEVKDDIEKKREEINSLLSDATIKTLAEGYMESMCEYSKPKDREYNPGQKIYNIQAFFFNIIGRHLVPVLNYFLFILPLVGVSLLFVNEHTAKLVLDGLASHGESPSPLELIWVKTFISVPLIWIAWHGQRNISQRKRLFEEYNHKLRVVQMYLHFLTNTKTYELKDRNKLEKILFEVIGRNPSEVFGRDETMIDKLIELARANKDVVPQNKLDS